MVHQGKHLLLGYLNVRKKFHVNGLENLWCFAKRRLTKFNGLTDEKFILHLKECECRYDYRNGNVTLFWEQLYFKNKKRLMMFDIFFQTVPEQIDNTSILLMCFAGNITIFAFGYPYIFRAINNLSIISSILCDRVKNNRFIKFYTFFLLIVFIFNAISLFASKSINWSILLVGLLLIHIIYVMSLYYFIENRLITPFNAILNKDIHEANSTFKKSNELENDIILLIDIIYYFGKDSFKGSELQKYFDWLVDANFLKFKNYDITKFETFARINSEDKENLFSILSKIQWLNQWAVNEKKIITLDYINYFYSWILWYGIEHPKYFDYTVFPLLQSIQNTKKLSNEYKKEDMVKYIQECILEYLKYTIWYRVNNNFISNNEMYSFVELLYYCISYKLEIKQNEKYTPCFSIVSKMIDNNFSERHYHQMISMISKHYSYVRGENNIYNDICGFHINVMAYFIYKNQYQMLKSYMYYEESPERYEWHIRPQIPNHINDIIFNFIGNNSVLNNTQTFSANVSSFKYKFYILFLMLNYSKIIYNDFSNHLKQLDKENINYDWINNHIKYYSCFSLDLSTIHFDILTSYLSIEDYKKYYNYFKLEKELLNIFNVSNDNLIFISKILDDIILKIKEARNILLQEKISDIVKKELSYQGQKGLKAKNIEEFFNDQSSDVIDNIKKIKFSCKDTSKLITNNIILYQQNFNKKDFLLKEEYKRLIYKYNIAPKGNFYNRLLNLLINSCKEVKDITQFPNQLENYEIISTIFSKNSFLEFGFSEENLKCISTMINRKLDDHSVHAEIKSVIINGKEINISKNNWNFRLVNNSKINNSVILLIDPSKLDISIEERQPIQFTDIGNEDIEILDTTKVIVNVPKDKELGYYITKK